MNMNASTSKNQVTDDKKRLFPVRVEYKIMDDFKKTLSKRPWEYLEEGNYEKYLKASEVKKEPSTHRKELLEVYAEILTLIKDKQKHINSQFVNPKYDLVKHDFKCICNNTFKFQYYMPYEHQKSPKQTKVSEKEKVLESQPVFEVKELNFDKLKVPDVSKGEKPQFVSSRRESDYSEIDPVVENYFDAKQVKPQGTKLKKKDTKKMDVKEPFKREETKTVKFDGISEESLNKYLESDRTSSSDVPKKSKKKEKQEVGFLEHKNTFDAKDLMCLPSLDLETLLEKKLSYKREPKVEPKADVVSPPVKVSSSTKKSSDNVNPEDKVSHQESEMRNDLLHLLESVPVFSDLPKSRHLEIIKHFKLKSYFAQSSIILAGEVPQEFYIVASGTVSSFTYEDNNKSNVYKRTYFCSEYFGETFLMDDTVSDEFFVADSHVTVQAVNASVFKTVFSDLFEAFRNRNKEFNNYGTYKFNTLVAPSSYFTNMELDKFASGDNTIKAISVLGSKLIEFLNSYPSLSKFRYLEKLSKRFSYQEYLAKEILVGVCRNDNLFLVYKGTVSLQVYDDELKRQLELVSFGPGTFFFKFKYKSELVSGLMEKSSFVAKEKVVLLCLEDKYVLKYLTQIIPEMSNYLENLYKSGYKTLEEAKSKYLESDQSSTSSKSVHSDVGTYNKDQQETQPQVEQEDDRSVQETESVSSVSLKSEEVSDRTDGSSVVSSSSASVLSSTSRDDSSRNTRSSRSDGPSGGNLDSSKTGSVDNYSESVSDVQSRTSDQQESKDDYVVKEQKQEKHSSQKDLQQKLDKGKVSKKFSGSFNFTGGIVSRKSFDDPADVSIRSSLQNPLESSRTVSSVDSSRLEKLQSKGFKKDEDKELESSRSATTEKDDDNLLLSSINKLNQVFKSSGLKQTDSVDQKDNEDDKGSSSKRSHDSKSLASSKDDEDFMDKLMNKIEGYKFTFYSSDTPKDDPVEDKQETEPQVERDEKEEGDEPEDKEESEEEERDVVKSVGRVNVDEEDLIRRISEEDFELIRKNTLLASHVNISDTELSSRSHLSSALNQGSKSYLSRSHSYRSERTGDTENKYSSLREGSSVNDTSNVGKDSKDSEVSSVGSDVKFIFNLEDLKSGGYKPEVKHVVNLPKMNDQPQLTDSVEQKDNEEKELERRDSSRVMGNDNFVDIRDLSSYHGKLDSMGVANIYEEMDSLLEREMSEMSGKIVYRNTSSSHLLTSRTTNENVLDQEDLSSVVRELGDVVEQQQVSVEVPSLTLDLNKQETQEKVPDVKPTTKEDKEEGDEPEDKDLPLVSHRSTSSLESLINKNYPGVEESVNSVMEVMRTRTSEFKTGGTLTGLDMLYQSNEEDQTEDKQETQEKEMKKESEEEVDLVQAMGTIDEKELDKSPSLDFAEVPNLSKILSKVHEIYVNPNLPVESVSDSKFSSIDDVYVQLEKIEKLYQPKSFDDVTDKQETQLQVEKEDEKDKPEDKEKEVESLFDYDRLNKQSSYASNNTLSENIYDSERDEVVPNETSEKEDEDKKEGQFDLSFENIKNKLTSELSIQNLTKELSLDKLSSQLSIENLTKDITLDNITRELSNIGSSISSQISGAFSSKSSIVDQQEVNLESDSVDQKDNEDETKFSFVEKPKLKISIFDNTPLYNSDDKPTAKEDSDKPETQPQVEQEEKEILDVKKEVEEFLNKENILIDKYNLVSRISLDSPSDVTSTSSSDKESVLSKQSESNLSEVKELESSRSATTEKDDDTLTSEKEDKEDLSLKSPENVAIDDGPLSTDRSDETFSSLKSSTVKSLTSSIDESLADDQKENETEEPDLISNVGKSSKDSEVSSVKEESEEVHSLLTSEIDAVDSQKSFVTSERDTDKYTEKSLVSSLDKSEKNNLNSSISVTESINDNSFLSTDSESHLTSSSDSGSYDFKDNSYSGTDRSLDPSHDEIASILSSLTSRTSEPLDSGRISNAESLISEKEERDKTSEPTESESSRRTSSIDSNFDSSDQQENTGVGKYNESNDDRNLDRDVDSFSDDESDFDSKDSVDQKDYDVDEKGEHRDEDGFLLDNDFEMLEETFDSEEEEFEYDEESILSIKNLLMSTLKNKYKSLGASFIAMDFERSGKVTCEVFLSFIEKLGIGAIDHREQNLMFELLKEDNQDYITFASFYRCSGETVTTLSELNQHFISIFGSSRIAFEKFFTTLKKSTRCSQVDFVLILNQVGIGEDYANKLFDTLDVCKNQNVTVFTMLKMIVGDWDEKVALEYEQKINTNLNRLLTYLSPESLEEFNSEFTRTLSSQFFDQSVEGSLVTDAYEEFYIERDLKYFDQLSSLLSEQKEFSGISLAQKRFIVSLFNVIDTSTAPQEAFMTESGQMDEQEVVLVSSKEVEAPLVALISGTVDMGFEGITFPRHLNLTVPCLPNYYQFVSSVKNFENQPYMSGYYDSPQGSAEFNQPKPECGYSLSFKFGPNKNTVVGLMPLASYLYNVLPLLNERKRRLPVMLQFLKSVPSFNVYSPDELDKIVSACTVRQFKLHETVIRTGETPTHFYLVFDGTLTVTNEYNFEFKTVGKTEFFSSYDLVNNQLNNFTLIANCSLVLLSWERNEFFRVFNKYSTLVENDACNLNDFENLGLQKLVDKKVSFAECP